MKKRLWLVAGVILAIALAVGIKLWRDVQEINREAEHTPELWSILTLAENKGADWATDELMMNNVDSFRKKSLYQKWGEPTRSAETANEDIWILSDQFQIIVDYKDDERAGCIKVVSTS